MEFGGYTQPKWQPGWGDESNGNEIKMETSQHISEKEDVIVVGVPVDLFELV